MSKYNFKVGDKVKVREDLGLEHYGVIDSMLKYKGREVTIESIYLNEEYNEYRFEEMGYTWTDDCIVELTEKPVFKVGDEVELISIDLYDEMYRLKVGDVGIITCLEADTYCRIDFSPTNMNNCVYYKQIKLSEPNITKELPTSIPNKGTIKYRITDDGITYATLNGHNSGKSVKSDKDESNHEIGILIATARALGFNEDRISGIVDVLFDDYSNTKAKCENAIIKNDIARALSILDKYKE